MPIGAILVASLVVAQPGPDSLVVTLLGTGTPQPRIDRMGPSTLIEAGGRRLLFDAGRGVAVRLAQAGVQPGAITTVFLTHLHSDHTTGLPDLWLTGWLPPVGARATPVHVIGPRGTRGLARGLEAAYAEDIRLRVTEERLPPKGAELAATEFESDTVVFNEDGLVVEAFEVDHGGELRPAYGYRIRFAGRTVVLSGDTRYSANLVAKAKGADLIVQEVVMAPLAIQDQPPIRFIMSHHTSPADVARIFVETRPRLAILSHFALPVDRRTGIGVTPAEVLAEVRKGYPGPVEAGQDLLRIVVGREVRVVPPGR